MQKFYSKKFYTIENQVELLKNRGLSFGNEEVAREVLLQKNYFDVINGFETLLLKDPKAKKKEYEANYYFEHFVELYKFDKLLSSVILQKIEAFENRLKTSIAYRFAEYANNNSSSFNPAFYLDLLMYDNPYSIHNRLNALPANTITEKIVDEFNKDITRHINREISNIETKINALNTTTVEYINKKTRNRLFRLVNRGNTSLLSTINALAAANVVINQIPAVRSTGNRISLLNQFSTNLITTRINQIPSTPANARKVQSEVTNFVDSLEEVVLRIDKVYSQVALNNNTSIYNFTPYDIRNFTGHNLFRTNHGPQKNKSYIDYSKDRYSYLQTYNIPPFWVIIKTFELGSILKLVFGLKDNILNKVLDDMGFSTTERHIFINSIKIITDLRNHCAHFGLINRYRSKDDIRINNDLTSKLNLVTKSNGNIHYQIRLYDTLKVLAQFNDLKEVNSLFEEFFNPEECIIKEELLVKFLDRMGNDDFAKWCNL